MSSYRQNIVVLSVLVLLHVPTVSPIKCNIGYGQRGLKRSTGFQWPRDCPDTHYCWEAVTRDISIMRKFFDFEWDEYYNIYYVKACGGEYGTSPHQDPYQRYVVNGKRVNRKTLPGKVFRVNLTVPDTITGRGGTEELDIHYVCRGNFCSGGSGLFARSALALALLLSVAAGTLTVSGASPLLPPNDG